MIPGVHKTDELLHAYLFEGERRLVFELLCAFLEKQLDIPTRGNPDFYLAEGETLTIEVGRDIKERSSWRAVGALPKIFVLSFNAATREAQNALLKIFEEPTPHTHFFMIVPQAHVFLPTLRSRLFHVPLDDRSTAISEKAKQFLKVSLSERLKLVQEIIEAKDKALARTFLQDIERTLYEKVSVEDMSPHEVEVLKEVILFQKYLNDRSPSLKLLLEHIALRL